MSRFSPAGERGPLLSRVGGPTLWSILTQPDAISSAPAAPVDWIKQDVLRNIREVLNARRGRCMGHPDYGMPDVSEFFVSPRGLTRLVREIKQTIERWEPRVARGVDVRAAAGVTGRDQAAEGMFRATFVIRAKLAAPWNELCTFRTTFIAGGQVEVEP